MPPVFDALHAVFPSFSEQPASAADEGVHSVSDAAETQLQASPDVIEAYSGRISVINAQVCSPRTSTIC